jgi:pimeloyl-ACP methyl ester carboxylesterase
MTAARSELRITTDDGVSLAIHRFAPAQRPARGAVVLQHGLGSNGLVFTLSGVSLADHLCALGYECFVPDLRGAGKSGRGRGDHGLDAYLEHDVPAILRAALEHSGQAKVHWIGHSMGGFLMWMYALEHPDAPVSRLVTVGSAIDYRPGRSVYRSLRRLLPLVSLLPVLPFALITRALAPLAGQGPILLPEGMNFHRSNVERAVCRRLMAGGFAAIPLPLFAALESTFSEQGFARARGAITYLSRMGEFRIPTLVVGGSRDLQATPEAVLATFERLSGVEDKRLLMCGVPHGHGDEYGHFDLIVGKRAQSEVWPHIAAFLEAPSVQTAAAARASPLNA